MGVVPAGPTRPGQRGSLLPVCRTMLQAGTELGAVAGAVAEAVLRKNALLPLR